MGGRNRGKTPKLAPFVPLLWDTLNSRAYKSLPSSAAKALPYFIGKTKLHVCTVQFYETSFSLSYAEARSLGFSSSTFSKVIRDLVDFGFIDPVEKGGLKSFGNSTSKFKCSKRWEKYGTKEFIAKSWDTHFPRADAQQPQNLKRTAPIHGRNSENYTITFHNPKL